MAGVRGRSGGRRLGASRKPKSGHANGSAFVGPSIPRRILFERDFVGPLWLGSMRKPKKVAECPHAKPLFSNGKPRKFCFECQPKKQKDGPRKPYEFNAGGLHKCEMCGALHAQTSWHNKYCSDACRIKAGNLKAFNRSKKIQAEKVKHRKCLCCGKEFQSGNDRKLYCSRKCRDGNDKALSVSRKYRKNKCETDMVFAMSIRLRRRICDFLRCKGFKKRSKTEVVLGCSYEKFKAHLEAQFCRGMSWDNRSEWHIDHIVPLATAKNLADMERLNHYSNLRPMWAADNLAKGSKVLTIP